MRFALFSSLALAVAFVIGTVAFVPEAAGIKVPADFSFEQGKGSPGPVTSATPSTRRSSPSARPATLKCFR
jgi:hypothetical protein